MHVLHIALSPQQIWRISTVGVCVCVKIKFADPQLLFPALFSLILGKALSLLLLKHRISFVGNKRPCKQRNLTKCNKLTKCLAIWPLLRFHRRPLSAHFRHTLNPSQNFVSQAFGLSSANSAAFLDPFDWCFFFFYFLFWFAWNKMQFAHFCINPNLILTARKRLRNCYCTLEK